MVHRNTIIVRISFILSNCLLFQATREEMETLATSVIVMTKQSDIFEMMP